MREGEAREEVSVTKGSSQERESSEGWSTYSRLHCLQMATRALLKCLGLDHSSTSDHIITATQTPSRVVNDEGEDESRAYRHIICSTESVSVVEQGPAPSSGTVSDHEQGMKTSEDVAAAKSSIFSTLNLMIRRPPKPPVSSGRGGQHN
ncbi:hypothetical protein Scep_002584 [Stephania cephalantha]|uniref:Uncharacterized protein n=1 Tax=Stephania cephalantha TaxID=152367 RepID=A0AAP0Q542_9MAGN